MAIKILSLHKKNKSFMSVLSMSTPISELLQNLDINTTYYIEVEHGDTKPFVNLSLLLLETSIGKLNTLAEIEMELTPLIVESYASTIVSPGNTSKSLIATQLMHTWDFNVSYVNKDVPGERDVPLFMYRLPDIVITKTNEKNETNFDNCLVSINGLLSKPTVFEDELYMPLGTTFMRSFDGVGEDRQPDILLLDFSEIGDMSIVPLSDCTLTSRGTSSALSMNSDIEVLLPDGVDISNKTTFLVLAHTFHLRYKPSVVNGNTLLISPNKLNLQDSLLKLDLVKENYVNDTGYIESTSINEYLTTLKDKDNQGAFLVVIDNPRILVTEESTLSYPVDTYTSVTSSSLLFNGIYSSFVSNVEVDYLQSNDSYLQAPYTFFNVTNSVEEKPKATITNNRYSSYKHITSTMDRCYKVIKMVGV